MPRTSTRTKIGLICVAVFIVGTYLDNLAVQCIAAAWGWIAAQLHTIEVKLNKLLDHHGITVWDSDIAKE